MPSSSRRSPTSATSRASRVRPRLDRHPRRRSAHHRRSLPHPVGRAARAGRRRAQVEIVIGPMAEQRLAAQLLLGGEATTDQVGLEADNVTWNAAAHLGRPGGRRPARPHVQRGRGAAGPQGRGRDRPHGARSGHCRRRVVRGAPAHGARGHRRALRLELDTAMRRGGAESTAFETIVAAGENSAKPHHHPWRSADQPGRSCRGRLRGHVRGLSLRHDAHVLRRR